MQILIKVYSKQKSKKALSGVATIDRETQTITVADDMPTELAKDKATRTAIFILASRYRAFLEVDKKLPALLFVSVTIQGTVYSSESALVQTKMENLVRVSMAGLAKIPVSQVIAAVTDIHTKGLKSSLAHISRIRAFMEADEVPGTVEFTGLTVDAAGILA